MKTEIITSLKRQAAKILTEPHKTREPVLITLYEKPSAHLVDVDGFGRMQERMRILDGIAGGGLAISENRVHSHSEAKRKMKKWLK